eukprot:TRINITY_DN8722_c0_g2_i6.p1 TRINITY_DN8722_c0_g2~~TRINITY_DN8722_c0_g2_i6.p1  ORF type:complete len:334 (+),score=60.63 TRINITY_DN8722_c0_g2_i6:370-1371(+)
MLRNNSDKTLRPITSAEVETHSSENDAWLIIDGYVHNITQFLSEHPGGKEIVLPYLGKDATQIFSSETEHAHSQAAYTILKKYRIGVLDGKTTTDRVAGSEYLAGLVDVKKAMVPQVWRLGDNYQKWIHTQTGLEKIIIFDNFLEKLSRWPWYYIFFMWLPVITYLLYLSIFVNNVTVVRAFSFWVAGILIWAGVEYYLHRFIFHVQTSSPVGNLFHFFIHGIHHITPTDSTRLTFPPFFALFVGSALYRFYEIFVSPELGGQALFAGSATGYLFYDTMHYYFHHGEVVPWMPELLKKMKTLHLNHHYKDDTKNYGVTSPAFDWIFGTMGSQK